MPDEKKESQNRNSSVNSVVRALDILEYLTYASEPVGVSAISRHLAINRTTTYSLVNALIKKRYITKLDDGKYKVTSRLLELGTVFQDKFPLTQLVKMSGFPFLDDYKCVCKLIILEDNKRAVIIFSRSSEDELFHLPLGYSYPLHTSASGKVLLGYSSPAVVDEYIATNDFKQYTENTITDREQFRRELENVRENGYAADIREYDKDLVCFAAPVMNSAGVIAAITVSGRPEYMLAHRNRLVSDIMSYTRSLSLKSGYNHTHRHRFDE